MKVTIFLVVFYFAAIAFAGPPFDIDEFIDNRDGKTVSLIVTCANSRKVTIQMPKAALKKLNVDRLYDMIEKERSLNDR